jgi:hypothetical protein
VVGVRLGRHLCAIAATAVAGLCGVWLMVSPWTLGLPQPGSGWGGAVLTDFWTGLGVVVVSALTMALYGGTLAAALRRAGLLPRPERRPVLEAEEPTPAEANGHADGLGRALPEAAPRPAPAAAGSANLDDILMPIATALLSDLVQRRAAQGAAQRAEGGERS